VIPLKFHFSKNLLINMESQSNGSTIVTEPGIGKTKT
jgi:hypothetical protein